MERFDVLVVGGGAAGCAVAARVSANPAIRVALVEAGRDTPPDHTDEVLWDGYPIVAYFDPRHHWTDLRVRKGPRPTEGPDERPLRRYEQGKVMGGGSSINGMMANRGGPADYDGWAAAGAEGWDWNGVLPYFRRMEHDLDFGGPMHGADGPIPVRRWPRSEWGGFSLAASAALDAEGFPQVDDQNGADFRPAHFPLAVNNDARGRRASTATSYLTAAVRARPNLTILPETRVRKLLLDGRRATGVEVVGSDGARREIGAGEVVLCSGALFSPSIMLKSGLGPASDLARWGIQPVVDLPGVGRNLQEHPQIATSSFLAPQARIPQEMRRHIFTAWRWSSGAEGCPENDMFGVVVNRGAWHPLGQQMGGFLIWVNRCASTGEVGLAGADPDLPPAVDLNLFSDRRDTSRLADGLEMLERMYRHPAMQAAASNPFPTAYTERSRDQAIVNDANRAEMQALADSLDAGGASREAAIRQVSGGLSLHDMVRDRAALEAFIVERGHGTWHCSCTLKMGRADDPMAVTDPAGRVRGVAGLRVADASIMPYVPSANTNFPAIMIGEKISDAILADWA